MLTYSRSSLRQGLSRRPAWATPGMASFHGEVNSFPHLGYVVSSLTVIIHSSVHLSRGAVWISRDFQNESAARLVYRAILYIDNTHEKRKRYTQKINFSRSSSNGSALPSCNSTDREDIKRLLMAA